MAESIRVLKLKNDWFACGGCSNLSVRRCWIFKCTKKQKLYWSTWVCERGGRGKTDPAQLTEKAPSPMHRQRPARWCSPYKHSGEEAGVPARVDHVTVSYFEYSNFSCFPIFLCPSKSYSREKPTVKIKHFIHFALYIKWEFNCFQFLLFHAAKILKCCKHSILFGPNCVI
jgi:hypothetical protein